MIGSGTKNPSARRFAGGLSGAQFLGIAGLFWVYVAMSNILYAYSMRIGMSRMTNVSVFAAWDARLLQHLMLCRCCWCPFGRHCGFNGVRFWSRCPCR
jgi:hypothetical protein